MENIQVVKSIMNYDTRNFFQKIFSKRGQGEIYIDSDSGTLSIEKSSKKYTNEEIKAGIETTKYFLEKLKDNSKIDFEGGENTAKSRRYWKFRTRLQSMFKDILLKPLLIQLELNGYTGDLNDIDIYMS